MPEGARFYGPESTVTHTQQPFIEGYRVKSHTAETAWAEVLSSTPGAFLLQGPAAYETFEDTDLIDVTSDPDSYPLAISSHEDPTFHVNLTVSSVGTPEGAIWQAGPTADNQNKGIIAAFDASGNLIVRAGTTDPLLYQLADTSSMVGHGLCTKHQETGKTVLPQMI